MGAFATTAFLTLFVIVDPIGLSAIFLSLTDDYSPEQRARTARKATLIAGGLMLTFLLVGEPFLRYLGISLEALQIAGGILLFTVAYSMLGARRERQTPSEEREAHEREDIAVFPLAIPVVSGPGAFAALLVLAAATDGRPAYVAVLVGVIALVLVFVYLALRLATPINKALGETGTSVVTRVFGIILAALAVQLIIDAVVSIFGL